jgi:biotin/methionine sulfoxide reductase
MYSLRRSEDAKPDMTDSAQAGGSTESYCLEHEVCWWAGCDASDYRAAVRRADAAVSGVKSTQTASHWGVYSVQTSEAGEVLGVTPFAGDPNPTRLMHGLPDMVRSPLRIDRPYVRAGYLRKRGESRAARGSEPFVPVTWDAALELVASELRRVKETFGNEAIYGGSYGWASAGRFHHSPSVLKRFLGGYGGFTDKRGNHSFGAALGVLPYVLGHANVPGMVIPWSSVVRHTKLIVMFGGAHVKNMQVGSGGTVLHDDAGAIERTAAAKVAVCNISPSRDNVAAALNAQWFPIRPNTDTAFMLGLAHCLVEDGLHDRAFLARYCTGYERFERYLTGAADGRPKDARWAADITGVAEEEIRSLARRMARERTLITTTWSVQRADHGEQPVWMTITLAAMLGQIGLPGGGFSLGFGAVSGSASPPPAGIPRPTLPLGPNAVRTFVPVGRVADMLLHPDSEIEYDGERIRLPDTKLVYSVGGNPFHHNLNLNRFLAAWQRPETVIVHEPWWNPAAKYADIVLPATTTMERNDILATEGERHFIAMYQVIPPVGQARNDFDIFADLAARLNFAEAYTEGRDEMAWLRHMYDVARDLALERGFTPPGFDVFWSTGQYEFPLNGGERLLMGEFRADPDAHPLATPSGRIELFSERIAGFAYDDCPGHAVWLEPAEWLGGESARTFPIHLLSNQPVNRLHSQLDAGSVSRESKLGGREPIALNPIDAARRNIRHGDAVRVFNERGAFVATAVLSGGLMPNVAQVATGAWYDPEFPGRPGALEKHGNPNVVTLDKGTSRLAQSPIAQTVLVEIERCADPPAVTAFDLPPFQEA